MKLKMKLFSDIPINALVIPLLLVFVLQAGLIMFYNSNNLTFPGINSFYSLARAAGIADSNFTSMPSGIPALRESNGFLYPALASVICKVAGKYNTVLVIYFLAFFSFLLCAVLFYKIALGFFEKDLAAPAAAVFITAPAVALSMFSGGDVLLAFILLSLNAYFIFYHIPAGRYTGAWITAVLLCMVNFSGLMFGLACIAYMLLYLNGKSVRKHYTGAVSVFFGGLLAAIAVLCVYVFIDKVSASFFSQNQFFETKTFQVDTFFKDGFLWSKAMPPFFAVFFFIALFVRLAGELREKKTGFAVYAAAITLAAFLMEFFSVFSQASDTVFFMGPFYLIMVLYGTAGINDAAVFVQQKKPQGFTAKGIYYGVIALMVLVNVLFLFNKSIERNNSIKNNAGSPYVEKFIER